MLPEAQDLSIAVIAMLAIRLSVARAKMRSTRAEIIALDRTPPPG